MKKIVPENAVLIPEQAERVFQGVIFDVYQWQQEMFDGTKETFEMLRSTDILKIFAVLDGKLVVLEEQQPHVGRFMDIPGGRHDVAGESYLEAAQREVLEETGMTFSDWRLVNVLQSYNKFERFTYFFLATGLVNQDSVKLDAGEKINVTSMDFDEYYSLGLKGKIRTWPALPDGVESLDQLLELPEYKGKEIEVR